MIDKTAIIHPTAEIAEDAIIGPNVVIGENVKINYVIADKDCNIKSDVELSGAANYPVCISKGTKS